MEKTYYYRQYPIIQELIYRFAQCRGNLYKFQPLTAAALPDHWPMGLEVLYFFNFRLYPCDAGYGDAHSKMGGLSVGRTRAIA